MYWCGVDDLKASLILGTKSPLLELLQEGGIRHVCILCRNNQQKTSLVERHAAPIEQHLDILVKLSLEEREKLYLFTSGSLLLNQHFEKWLKAQLRIRSKVISIETAFIHIKHPNDSEALYQLAHRELQSITKGTHSNHIGLALDSGSSLTNYIWGLLIRRHPRLKLSLISSGVAVSASATPPQPKGEKPDLQLILHLMGEELINTLRVIQIYPKAKHIFMHEPVSAEVIQALPCFLPEGLETELFPMRDGDDVDQLSLELRACIQSQPYPNRSVGINLTSGSTLMQYVATESCRKEGYVPLAIEHNKQQLVFLDSDFSLPIAPINSVDSFIALYQPKARLEGRAHHSVSKSQLIHWWKRRHQLAPIIGKKQWNQLVREAIEQEATLPEKTEVLMGRVPNYITLEEGDDDIKMSLTDSDKLLIRPPEYFSSRHELLARCDGSWLIEHSYHQLLSIPHLRDIQMSQTLMQGEEEADIIDLIFTDGYRLFVVACIDASPKDAHIAQLIAMTQRLGGKNAIPILISSKFLGTGERSLADLTARVKLAQSDIIWNQAPMYYADSQPERRYQTLIPIESSRNANDNLFIHLIETITQLVHKPS